MKITIKATNLELNLALREFIDEKMNSLERFLKIFQQKHKYYNGFFGKGKPRAEMWLELERTTKHHRKGIIFRAEGQLRIAGEQLRVTAQDEHLRAAITTVKDLLQRELKQYKGKKEARYKRAARKIKRLFGWG